GVVVEEALVKGDQGRDGQEQEQNADTRQEEEEGPEAITYGIRQGLNQRIGHEEERRDAAHPPDNGDQRIDDAGRGGALQVGKAQREQRQEDDQAEERGKELPRHQATCSRRGTLGRARLQQLRFGCTLAHL